MSGLINSAGSKSGVIGTTELDYEEGTFTATARNGNNATAYYTKIGNLVKFAISIWNIASTGGSAEFHITGLPFTPDIADVAISVGPTHQVNTPTNGVVLRAKCGDGDVSVLFYWQKDDDAYGISTCTDFDSGSAGIQVSGTYMT
jgi:hypothetical protein